MEMESSPIVESTKMAVHLWNGQEQIKRMLFMWVSAPREQSSGLVHCDHKKLFPSVFFAFTLISF